MVAGKIRTNIFFIITFMYGHIKYLKIMNKNHKNIIFAY